MKKEVVQPKPTYEKPTIEVLGNFADLTLGNKAHGLGDLSHGLPAHPGS
jgi:hypothetical protein